MNTTNQNIARACDSVGEVCTMSAVRAGASEAVAVEPAQCPECDGSGEVMVMSDGGPDAYEVGVFCPHCNGSGTLDAAYAGVVKLLEREERKYHEAAAILYLNGPNRDAAARMKQIAEHIKRPGASLDWAHDRLIALADMADAGATPSEDADDATPGPWFVRKRERDGELLDCFVAAPDFLGLPYDAEILGDDEYRDGKNDDKGDGSGLRRKLADCELIVKAVNGLRASRTHVAPTSEAVAWAAVHFGGKRMGKIYNTCETREQIDAYIGQVHQSNDSITLIARPIAFADAAPPAAPAQPPAKVEREALTPRQLSDCAREAQIDFCMNKAPSFEVAFARRIESMHGIPAPAVGEKENGNG